MAEELDWEMAAERDRIAKLIAEFQAAAQAHDEDETRWSETESFEPRRSRRPRALVVEEDEDIADVEPAGVNLAEEDDEWLAELSAYERQYGPLKRLPARVRRALDQYEWTEEQEHYVTPRSWVSPVASSGHDSGGGGQPRGLGFDGHRRRSYYYGRAPGLRRRTDPRFS